MTRVEVDLTTSVVCIPPSCSREARALKTSKAKTVNILKVRLPQSSSLTVMREGADNNICQLAKDLNFTSNAGSLMVGEIADYNN